MSGDGKAIEELERRRADELARAHAALAAAQDRSYWLDRWHLDLNALMRRRGAGELRAAVRAARAVYRSLYNTSDRLRRRARAAPARARGGMGAVREERRQAEALSGAGRGRASGRLSASPVSERLRDRMDADDPNLLVALQRADVLVDALARAGGSPAAGQAWVGVGAGAASVLEVLREAYPELEQPSDTGNGAVDVAIAIASWGAEAPLDRLGELREAVKPGGRVLLGIHPHSATESLSADRVLAECTPDWHVTLFLPGGMEGDRDLYVLERA